MRNCASGNDGDHVLIAPPQNKNPPRISADGFLSEAIHFEQNTLFDRTSQTKFEVFSTGGVERSGVVPVGFAKALRINGNSALCGQKVRHCEGDLGNFVMCREEAFRCPDF
jgi:hypothetical protein